MNLFEQGRRGIRICLALALKYEQDVSLHVDTIAYQCSGNIKDIKYLCEKLTEAGFLKRERTVAKSYKLNLPPGSIHLGDIVRTCEEDIFISDCNVARQCSVKNYCFFDKKLWGNLLEANYKMLNDLTLDHYLQNINEMSYIAPQFCWLTEFKGE